MRRDTPPLRLGETEAPSVLLDGDSESWVDTHPDLGLAAIWAEGRVRVITGQCTDVGRRYEVGDGHGEVSSGRLGVGGNLCHGSLIGSRGTGAIAASAAAVVVDWPRVLGAPDGGSGAIVCRLLAYGWLLMPCILHATYHHG